MLNLLKAVHVFLGMNALASGIALSIRMMTGRPFEAWVKNFLRFSLTSASLGLILAIKHTSVTQLLTMLTVYVSGFAIFSWRKYIASDSWGPAVVLSTMSVFCLETVIVAAHVLRVVAACDFINPTEIPVHMMALSASAILIFALLTTISLKRLHHYPSDSVMHKAAR